MGSSPRRAGIRLVESGRSRDTPAVCNPSNPSRGLRAFQQTPAVFRVQSFYDTVPVGQGATTQAPERLGRGVFVQFVEFVEFVSEWVGRR